MMRPTLDPHPDDDVLHDLVDGALAGDRRAGTEAHVARCIACAARVARLRRLLAAAAALPREVAPEADGWPALRARLAAREGSGASPARVVALRARAAWRTPLAALLAAALLLAAVGAWGAWGAWRRAAQPADTPDVAAPAVAVQAPGADAAAAFAAVERDYARATEELAAELDAARGRLPAYVEASLDRSLATIDSALAEARDALQKDPGNPELVHFVAASYEHKLDLLRRSTTIASGD